MVLAAGKIFCLEKWFTFILLVIIDMFERGITWLASSKTIEPVFLLVGWKRPFVMVVGE
jgi:hypothetical protein